MTRALLAVIVTASMGAVFCAVPALADTVGPSVTDVSPASGTAVPGGFTLTFEAFDQDRIDGPNGATVWIDGVAYTPTLPVTQGFWEDDPYEPWWVDDDRFASYVFQIPALPTQGLHAVSIEVTDRLGNTSTVPTTILKTAPITFAPQRPIAGVTYGSIPGIEVVVNGIVEPLTVTLEVDGVPVAATYESYGTGLGRVVSSTAVTGAGTHTVRVSAGDDLGGTPATLQWTVTLASGQAGPTIGVPTPSDGSIVQGPFTLNVRAEDPFGVNHFSTRLYIDGVPYGPPVPSYPYWYPDEWEEDIWYPDTTTADLAFSVPNLAVGTHHLTIAVANSKTPTSIVSTRDLTIVRGAQIDFLDRTPAPDSRQGAVSTVSARLVGSVDTNSVVLTLDGVPLAANVIPQADGAIVSYDGALSSGDHTARIDVNDTLGRPAQNTWAFVVDATPPSVSSASPSDGATVTDATSGLSVTITDDDEVDSSTVQLFLDGVAAAPLSVTASDTTVTASSAQTLAEGAHTLRVEARDRGGNLLAQEWPFSVADPPRFGSVTPAPTSSIGSIVTFQVPVTEVNSDLDPASLEVTLDSVPTSSSIDLSTSRSGTVSVPLVGLADGPHTVVARIRDIAGNLATKSWIFTADAVGPVLSGASRQPAPGTTVSTHAPANMGAVFIDGSGVDPSATRAWLDGEPFAVQSDLEEEWDEFGEYSWLDATTLLVSSQPQLHDGLHTFRVEAFDVHGNSTVEEWTFSVLEVPAYSDVMPADGLRTTTATFTASARISDFDGVDADTVKIEWRTASVTEPPGEWTPLSASFIPTSGVASAYFRAPAREMRYEIRFSAADTGGHSSSLTIDVYVASAKPSMTASQDCLSCHTTILDNHPMGDCEACHGSSCGDCHDGSPAFNLSGHGTDLLQGVTVFMHEMDVQGRTCTDCHEHVADTEAMRHATSEPAMCVRCHATSLTTEHAGRSTEGGGVVTCQSCHSSDEADVIAAVQAGDTTCTACHTSPHGHRDDCDTCHFDGPEIIDPSTVDNSGYAQWVSSEENSQTPIPHKGYLTGTRKCAVCHSVHRGSATGGLLQATSPGESCVFCHVVTEIGVQVVYAGDAENYYVPSDYAHNRTSQSACSNCHSVHGADTLGGAVSSKILRDWAKAPARSGYPQPLLDKWPDPANMSDPDAQITAFCTGCHGLFTQSSDETLTVYTFEHHDAYSTESSPMKSHLMTDDTAGFSNPEASLPEGTKVSWNGSLYCSSCHDAGRDANGNPIGQSSFPHYTPGAWRFLNAAESVDGTETGAIQGGSDGVCLKCHRSSTSGVGITF